MDHGETSAYSSVSFAVMVVVKLLGSDMRSGSGGGRSSGGGSEAVEEHEKHVHGAAENTTAIIILCGFSTGDLQIYVFFAAFRQF